MTLVDTNVEVKYQERRCQDERDSPGAVHEGVSSGSGKDGDRRDDVIAGSSEAIVFTAFDVRELGKSALGGQVGRYWQGSAPVSGRDKLRQKWSFKSEPLLRWSC